ncbi:MAG: outer membrane protein [Rickettsiaceae bacterium]|jgi:outer membrane protein|nr:outer membrane protein [Rickettsiaceae bacterium]
MKLTNIKGFLALCFAVTFAATFFVASSASAQNIAVIDLETVLKNSDAMKDAQDKISKKQAMFQKEIDKKQEALEKESKQLNSKKGSLSEDAFAKEQEKFSKKVAELKDMVNKRQDSLKKSSLEAISKINDKIKEVVEEIRKEKNLDVVISSTGTVFYKDELDISDKVTSKLNKKISKIDIK